MPPRSYIGPNMNGSLQILDQVPPSNRNARPLNTTPGAVAVREGRSHRSRTQGQHLRVIVARPLIQPPGTWPAVTSAHPDGGSIYKAAPLDRPRRKEEGSILDRVGGLEISSMAGRGGGEPPPYTVQVSLVRCRQIRTIDRGVQGQLSQIPPEQLAYVRVPLPQNKPSKKKIHPFL